LKRQRHFQEALKKFLVTFAKQFGNAVLVVDRAKAVVRVGGTGRLAQAGEIGEAVKIAWQRLKIVSSEVRENLAVHAEFFKHG